MNTNNNLDDVVTNVAINTEDFRRLTPPEVNPDADIMDLISDSDPRLHQASEPFKFDKDISKLILDLTATMRYHGGIGISAVQVGVPIQLFLVETGEERAKVFINTIIVDQSIQKNDLEEGCLSYKGIVVKVPRSNIIKVRYRDEHGTVFTEKFTGLTAQIISHEESHGRGLTLKDAVSRLTWERACKRAKKIQKKF